MWYKTIFPAKELPEMLKEDLTIIHNIDEHGLCGTALSHWWFSLKGKNATPEGFAKYIMSKNGMSGHEAYTEKDRKSVV